MQIIIFFKKVKTYVCIINIPRKLCNNKLCEKRWKIQTVQNLVNHYIKQNCVTPNSMENNVISPKKSKYCRTVVMWRWTDQNHSLLGNLSPYTFDPKTKVKYACFFKPGIRQALVDGPKNGNIFNTMQPAGISILIY